MTGAIRGGGAACDPAPRAITDPWVILDCFPGELSVESMTLYPLPPLHCTGQEMCGRELSPTYFGV